MERPSLAVPQAVLQRCNTTSAPPPSFGWGISIGDGTGELEMGLAVLLQGTTRQMSPHSWRGLTAVWMWH